MSGAIPRRYLLSVFDSAHPNDGFDSVLAASDDLDRLKAAIEPAGISFSIGAEPSNRIIV